MRAASHLLFKVSCFSSSWQSIAIQHFTRTFSSASDRITVERDRSEGIATIYMNHAPVNMADMKMLKACVDVFQSAENDPDVRGIILTSKFDGKVFSAGLNIYDMYQKSHDHVAEFWSCFQDWHLAIYGCRKPTVACINGHALAGGCALALMCDYRVMQGGAKKTIGFNEVALGLDPTFSVCDLLVRAIGQSAAEKACLTGKLFSAEEAMNIGLVDAIGDLKDLQAMAKRALLPFTSNSMEACGRIKLAMREKQLDHLRRVRHEEAQAVAERIVRPGVQKILGRYLKSLVRKK